MKISYDWLRQYIDTDADLDTISEILTEIGLEVEGIEEISDVQADLSGVLVAEVQHVEAHPNADKLKLCKVYDGENTYPIVCGAPNVRENEKVALATIGTKLTFKDGNQLTIKKSKIRGEESHGMLCSEEELGISDKNDGIMILKNDALLGTPLKEYLSTYTDHVIEIGLTPNRTDAMCHYGVARDLHAGLQSKKVDSQLQPIENIEEFENSEEASFKVDITTSDCQKYGLAHIKNIKIDASPEWLQNKLKVIGIEPKNNVVDITNYLLHSYGQPLHAFDASKIAQQTIIIGNAKEDVNFTTLDKTERTLHAEDLIIMDGDKNPIALAGVIGGLDSAVSKNTTEVVLESAYFNPVAVRKTAKRHGLNTDASFRFERGADPDITFTILKKAADMLMQIAGGEMKEAFVLIDDYSDTREKIYLRMQTLNTVVGNPIHRESIKQILESLDIEIVDETDLGFMLKVPAYRVDVTREIDVVEEVLRIYGYNKVETSEKFSFSLSEKENIGFSQENTAANYLTKNGFFEVLNSSLSSPTEKKNEVKLLNPLSSEISIMRTTMLDGMLQNISYNVNRNQKDVKFFEFGKIYFKNEPEYTEERRLSIGVSGDFYAESWNNPSARSNFFQLKGIVLQLLEQFNVSVEEKEYSDAMFEEALRLYRGKNEIATLGLLKKEVLKKKGISQAVLWADINWDEVCKVTIQKTFKLKEIPKYPGSRRDLALLLDKEVKYKELKEAAFKIDKKLLKEVNLFDVYEGKNLAKDKKSYALSYWFLDENKTITDDEIHPIMERIVKFYEEKFSAELRK